MSEAEKDLKRIRELMEMLLEGQRRQERQSNVLAHDHLKGMHQGEMKITRLGGLKP
ncbi:hypothetical protein [Stutzerimonas xanthomarina]|uniref:hypothetical protein n=1 Tax=Stutzerimonas xanthomarina TaxID=271420 RepID=UPI003AA9E0D4